MKKEYSELFDIRGGAYDWAMRQYPNARNMEFRQAIDRAMLKNGMLIADIPAGGGYLRDYLPSTCVWQGHEPCASFTSTAANDGMVASHLPLLPLPWRDDSIDAALSIAGVHHLQDKYPLFRELYRVVKPKGHFVLSDVATGSAVAEFLDGYVGDHNSTGHEGMFLDDHTLVEMDKSGWRVLSRKEVNYHWVFDDRQAMSAFCHGLFDLRHASEQDTIDAIETGLGIDALPDGHIGMRWSLLTIVAERK